MAGIIAPKSYIGSKSEGCIYVGMERWEEVRRWNIHQSSLMSKLMENV